MIKSKDRFREIEAVVVRFAGDSGDGIQTVGEQFTDASALAGNDIRTLPDFPAEIRAPAGSLPGVSGYQLQFGSREILTPGDEPAALVAMNPAALKTNLGDLAANGLLVVNEDAFTKANLRLAGYDTNPLDDPALNERFEVIRLRISELTKDALADSPLSTRDKLRCKNFFALGFMFWVYDRPIDPTLNSIQGKWGKRLPDLADANTRALKAGYFLGETHEISRNRYQIARARTVPGRYRKISGNDALIIGLIAAARQAGKDLCYAGYPITPASSILEGLARHKNHGVKTIQAEDEIAAAGMALGASYAGDLGVTGTSGPGMCLKAEFVGLAVTTELPLVIINVQRGGPSTGLPTKTEQGDLLQSLFGRNGESPLPVIAASSPADCFRAALEASRIALEYSTPVVLLSDSYIANGSEPWLIEDAAKLPAISVREPSPDEPYISYKRDPDTLARRLAHPGRPGFEHRIGGLEKGESGGVNYDPENHELMTHLRADKVAAVAKNLPPLAVQGSPEGDVLVIGWGGTHGAIASAVRRLRDEGHAVSNTHLTHLNPLHPDLDALVAGFRRILVPELNLGQLRLLLAARFQREIAGLNKVQGRPFTVAEIHDKITEILTSLQS
ncbi:MAG: 2-oxoacid:acceptor oxidoreductase subunit alpha [Opitutales bacterium]|nr:2-oxoacid:acceptor oxidoreductase subunit alpha [Opitutales bacterium]